MINADVVWDVRRALYVAVDDAVVGAVSWVAVYRDVDLAVGDAVWDAVNGAVIEALYGPVYGDQP